MVCVEEGQQKSKYIIQGLRPQDVKRDEYFVGHAVRPDHVFLRLNLGYLGLPFFSIRVNQLWLHDCVKDECQGPT